MHRFETKQQIFDAVAYGITLQGRPSYDAIAGCRYRIDGLKCAVGWLIPDELYEDELEGCSLNTVPIRGRLRQVCDIDDPDVHTLLRDLQQAHDLDSHMSYDHWWEAWARQMESVASAHKLSPAAVGTDMSQWSGAILTKIPESVHA